MFDNHDLESLMNRLGLEQSAQELIKRIKTQPPSRRVQGGAGNVTCRYPSRKMGMTIQAESHTIELPIIYQLEYDDDVLAYFDQPHGLQISYVGKNGRLQSFIHIPDFLVIKKDAIFYIEAKPEKLLAEKSEKQPNRFVRNNVGEWTSPPGVEAAAKYGFGYEVWTEKQFSWTYVNNLKFLEDYLQNETYTPSKGCLTAINKIFSKNICVSLHELIHGKNDLEADDIYGLLVNGKLFVDIVHENLADARHATVYQNRQTYDATASIYQTKACDTPSFPLPIELVAGSKFVWDGVIFTIINAGSTKLACKPEKGSIVEIKLDDFDSFVKEGQVRSISQQNDSDAKIKDMLVNFSQRQIEEANKRSKIISDYLNGVDIGAYGYCERTIKYWVSRFRSAEKINGYGFLGLLPLTKKKGNRMQKLSDPVRRLMDKCIEDCYENNKQKNVSAVYAQFQLRCEENGFQAPSRITFSQAIKTRPKYEATKNRKGTRAAYEHEPFIYELGLQSPRHGMRPMEICHIDHTQLDIELVSEENNLNLGRPWLSIMIDAYSRRIVGFDLSFDPPSSRTLMMVIRDCVRRFNFLPQTLVVDNGSEFSSVYFEQLLAFYLVTKKMRPPAKSRFGSVVERVFGTNNTMFIHNLQGNTQATKSVRQLTKAVNPKRHAIWTLKALFKSLELFLCDFYDTKPHPTLLSSPRDIWSKGMVEKGAREFKRIPYTENFVIMTMPSTPKGIAKVDSSRGVKINYVFYWTEAFRDPKVEKTQVEVRYDPHDMSVAYAFVNGRWEKLVSELDAIFKCRSEKEVRIASNELRASRQAHERGKEITARNLANFLDRSESYEQKRQKEKDDEARKTRVEKAKAAGISLVSSKNESKKRGSVEKIHQVGRQKTAKALDTSIYEDF